jgi:hypothetical protein
MRNTVVDIGQAATADQSGQVVAMFNITSQFDIRRSYNPQTGEETTSSSRTRPTGPGTSASTSASTGRRTSSPTATTSTRCRCSASSAVSRGPRRPTSSTTRTTRTRPSSTGPRATSTSRRRPSRRRRRHPRPSARSPPASCRRLRTVERRIRHRELQPDGGHPPPRVQAGRRDDYEPDRLGRQPDVRLRVVHRGPLRLRPELRRHRPGLAPLCRQATTSGSRATSSGTQCAIDAWRTPAAIVRTTRSTQTATTCTTPRPVCRSRDHGRQAVHQERAPAARPEPLHDGRRDRGRVPFTNSSSAIQNPGSQCDVFTQQVRHSALRAPEPRRSPGTTGPTRTRPDLFAATPCARHVEHRRQARDADRQERRVQSRPPTACARRPRAGQPLSTHPPRPRCRGQAPGGEARARRLRASATTRSSSATPGVRPPGSRTTRRHPIQHRRTIIPESAGALAVGHHGRRQRSAHRREGRTASVNEWGAVLDIASQTEDLLRWINGEITDAADRQRPVHERSGSARAAGTRGTSPRTLSATRSRRASTRSTSRSPSYNGLTAPDFRSRGTDSPADGPRRTSVRRPRYAVTRLDLRGDAASAHRHDGLGGAADHSQHAADGGGQPHRHAGHP